MIDDEARGATELLRARGWRLTGPRRAVIRVLAGRTDHLSAEEIGDLVAAHDDGIHRSSIYRSLEALTDAGIVSHFHDGHGPTRYHLATSHPAHVHLTCRGCGALLDAPTGLLDDVVERLARQEGFVVDDRHVVLTGTCAGCADA